MTLGASAHANEELAKSRQCMGCHAIDSKKLVGPGFAAIAAKYKGRKDATAYLAEKIQQGSKGTWGPIPMPPAKVSDDEAKALATWIQSL